MRNVSESPIRGILWMLATMFCFIVLDTLMKLALEHYSLVQVTWGRFFFAFVFSALICGRQIRVLAKSVNPRRQVGRSLLLMTTTALFNVGISRLPLATATTIMFMSPILVTLLSIAVLGEHVGWRRWLGIICGFAGALIVMQPWESASESYSIGMMFLAVAALSNASYQLVTRQVRADHPSTSLLYTAAAGAVVTSLILPWYWTSPDFIGWLLLIASGAAGCIGHLCIIRAFQAAPASVVAPFSYSSLVWATLLGFLIWQELPDLWTYVGGALIVGSGLYIFFRERSAGAKPAAATD